MRCLGVVGNFAEVGFKFFHPGPRVMAVNKSAQEAESFGYVTTIVTNVLPLDAPVDGQKLGHACGLGEEISGVAEC